MIRTIGVCAGEATWTRNAQEYALELARRFGARLRIVGGWEGAAGPAAAAPGEAPDELMKTKTRRLRDRAADVGIPVDEHQRGEGMVEGLKAEARQNDLLVLGSAADDAQSESVGEQAVLADDLEILRRAESAVLVVSRPPQPIDTILVNYQGELMGKHALRLAGAWGELEKARIIALSVESDATRAGAWAQTAGEYLKGFDLPEVETLHASGDPESEVELLNLAEKRGADVLVIGAKPYGLLDRFFDRDVAVDVALTTQLPLLVAR